MLEKSIITKDQINDGQIITRLCWGGTSLLRSWPTTYINVYSRPCYYQINDVQIITK